MATTERLDTATASTHRAIRALESIETRELLDDEVEQLHTTLDLLYRAQENLGVWQRYHDTGEGRGCTP